MERALAEHSRFGPAETAMAARVLLNFRPSRCWEQSDSGPADLCREFFSAAFGLSLSGVRSGCLVSDKTTVLVSGSELHSYEQVSAKLAEACKSHAQPTPFSECDVALVAPKMSHEAVKMASALHRWVQLWCLPPGEHAPLPLNERAAAFAVESLRHGELLAGVLNASRSCRARLEAHLREAVEEEAPLAVLAAGAPRPTAPSIQAAAAPAEAPSPKRQRKAFDTTTPRLYLDVQLKAGLYIGEGGHLFLQVDFVPDKSVRYAVAAWINKSNKVQYSRKLTDDVKKSAAAVRVANELCHHFRCTTSRDDKFRKNFFQRCVGGSDGYRKMVDPELAAAVGRFRGTETYRLLREAHPEVDGVDLGAMFRTRC